MNPVSPEQYDALQREIIETEQDLESLQTQARNTSMALETMAASGEKLKTIGTNITTAGQKMLPVTAAVTAMGTAVVKTSADFESSMSKVAARKELMRIQKVVAKRAKIKYGYNIDLSKFDAVKRQIKQDAIDKAKAKRRADRELQKKHKGDLADIMKQQAELRKLRKGLKKQ